MASSAILDAKIRSSGTGDPPLWICPKTIDLPEYPVSSLIRLASFSTSNIFSLTISIACFLWYSSSQILSSSIILFSSYSVLSVITISLPHAIAEYDYLVLNNGAMIVDQNDQVLYRKQIKNEIAKEILKESYQKYPYLNYTFFDGQQSTVISK